LQLILGDCLEKLKDIPDKSIDFVLTDPPYNLTHCKWDELLDFNEVFFELKRIIKDNGVIALFGTEPFSSKLRSIGQDIYKYDWYWKKCKSLGANFCHAKNSPIKTIETISIFSHGKINHIGKTKNRMNYNPQGLIVCKPIHSHHKFGKISSFRKYIERPSHKKYKRTITNYPDQIIDFKFSTEERKNRYHPTQKPVALLEYLIKTYTLEGETVLDFTMGSGSTGVAAKNLNRKFLGIEKDVQFFKIAKNRIG
jgi:site-specific DNA-methyltransferase (adenine-specific)